VRARLPLAVYPQVALDPELADHALERHKVWLRTKAKLQSLMAMKRMAAPSGSASGDAANGLARLAVDTGDDGVNSAAAAISCGTQVSRSGSPLASFSSLSKSPVMLRKHLSSRLSVGLAHARDLLRNDASH
jgi:hypothetical protein